MKKLISFFVFLSFTISVMAQTTLTISGYVTDIANGSAIPNHEVFIQSDSLNGGNTFPYYSVAFTNSNGFYADTVVLPAGVTQWPFLLTTFDCMNYPIYYHDSFPDSTTFFEHNFMICTSPQTCHAQFTYEPNQGLYIQFHDISTGGNGSRQWFFGDGSYSTVKDPQHLYASPGNYQVYLVIGDPATCIDSTWQMITVIDSIGVNCQAAFTYFADTLNSEKTLHFIDQSTGNISNWNWSFGDGTSATIQNPVHSYSDFGTYQVCLTISGDSCSSSLCQNVVIPMSTNTNQVYGQVFTGNSPLITGSVMIFSLDSNQNFNPYVEMSTIDSMGYYFFDSVPNGSYYIYAIPIVPENYLPTYYGDVLTWQTATMVSLGLPNNPYNINLLPSGNLMPGNANINGQVTMSGLKSTFLDKVTMILMNSDGIGISYKELNLSGEFTFPQLDYGTYYLRAEIPGITSDLVTVVLSPENPNATVQMTFSGTTIVGIKDDVGLLNSWSVFPNPVVDNLSISLELKQSAHAKVRIYNLTDQVVLTKSVELTKGVNKIVVSTSSLRSGNYFLQIESRNGLYLTTKLIITR